MRTRIPTLGAILALTLAVIVASPANAGERTRAGDLRFRMYGSGWGHGLGLSQWGAYGLALQGWGAERIVTHFYQGTRVGTLSQPSRLRVALVQWRDDLDLSAEAGPVQLRLGSPNGRRVGTIPQGSTWIVRPQDGRFRVLNARGKPVGGLWGDATHHLFARYEPLGSRVHLGDTGHSYARGFVEVNLHGGGYLRALAVLPVEEYLLGVTEVPTSWPKAAQRAQAIAARTYTLERVETLGQHRSDCNCAVRADGVDQVYWGWDREASAGGEQWVAAVRATARRSALYRGDPVKTFYHSSSGGYTESKHVVWGGPPIPYLRAVCDPGDFVAANPFRTWLVEASGSEIGRDVAAATGHAVGVVKRFDDVVRGDSGRIRSATVVGSRDSVRVSGWTLRAALGLRESKVWFNHDRNVTGAMRARYDALGCAPGLPKSPETPIAGGHRQAFARGALFHHHALGEVLWLTGPVLQKYLRIGQADGLLGLPVSDVIRMPKHHGRRAEFDAGAIFHRGKTGAHELHGRVLRFFRANGGVARFGFPRTDVERRRTGATWAEFDSGSRITCQPKGSCRASSA